MLKEQEKLSETILTSYIKKYIFLFNYNSLIYQQIVRSVK